MLSIIIDQREPKHIQELKFSNAQTVVSLLDAGDLMIATEDNQILLIERKEPNDLLGSIKDGRLFEQCHRMKQQSQWCYVVITGNVYPGPDGKAWVGQRATGWDFNAVEGALLTVQEMGIFVIHCKNDLDFGATVERLASRNRGLLSIGVARSSNVLSAGETMLTTLPGLGYEKVKVLLEKKKTPIDALIWLCQIGKNGSEAVPGISDGIKNNVRRALGLETGRDVYIDEIVF
jgi:ERCC4-type nuclease